MVTDLVGKAKRKPTAYKGGWPSPAAESWKGVGIEALRLLKFRRRVAGLKQRMGYKVI